MTISVCKGKTLSGFNAIKKVKKEIERALIVHLDEMTVTQMALVAFRHTKSPMI